ncbi:uncharacterized protein LOC135815221 [Sycon ciliatum]|uniref:uncharacterized protein LOC135815221 n=1 Tax=Sycon ciliatum TaxID=27933 RepID=UPI0031F5FC90
MGCGSGLGLVWGTADEGDERTNDGQAGLLDRDSGAGTFWERSGLRRVLAAGQAQRHDLPLATYLRKNAERGDKTAQRARFNTCMPDALKALGDVAEDERPDDMQVLKQLFKQLDPAVMHRSCQAQGQILLAMRHRGYNHYGDEGGASGDEDGAGVGQLLIHLIRARDLIAMDLRSNSSDPYITLELLPRTATASKVVRSKVVHERLSPVFDEYLSLPIALDQVRSAYVWLRVWDHDVLSEDDPMGQVMIPLRDLESELVCETPQPKWYDLIPEMDIPITGSLEVTLDWQPPLQLGCVVHSAEGLMLCRSLSPDSSSSGGDYGHLHTTLLCYLSGEENTEVSEVVSGTTTMDYDTQFSFNMRGKDVQSLALHLRIMTLLEDCRSPDDDSTDARHASPYSTRHVPDIEDVTYSGILAGECHIDLERVQELHGQTITIPLTDRRGEGESNTGTKVSARSQELQQALQAHALYGYPHLLFSGAASSSSTKTKVVQLRCSSTKRTAEMSLRNGVPLLRR